MKLLQLALLVLLILLLRKLFWCLLWLWRYYHGQETPDPISFLPRRSGMIFDEHVRQAQNDGDRAK